MVEVLLLGAVGGAAFVVGVLLAGAPRGHRVASVWSVFAAIIRGRPVVLMGAPPPRRARPHDAPPRPRTAPPAPRERPKPRTPKPGAPPLDFEVPTRNAEYLAALEKLADIGDGNMSVAIAITGPPGVGKHALLQRYLARLRHHGYLTEPPIEIVCTGEAFVDGPAIVGQEANALNVPTPEAQPGALRAAGTGWVVLHHAERMSRDAQVALHEFFDFGHKIQPFGATWFVSTEARLIAISAPRDQFPDDFRPVTLRGLLAIEICIPSLRARPEDFEPNLDYILQAVDHRHESTTTFDRAAREHYLQFAHSPFAVWADNFRDLTASVERLVAAAKANGGVIDLGAVKTEVAHLGSLWAHEDPSAQPVEEDEHAEMLRKYLARLGLTFDEIKKGQLS